MNINRNAAAVVDDCNAVIDVNGYINVVAVTRQSLIDGIIDDLIDQMMKSQLARVTDVHSWALSDRLQPF